MQLHRVKIKNFRLLQDVEIHFEPKTTLVVGRNNSGKTSLSEVVRRFTNEKGAIFQIHDFSTACYEDFCDAFRVKKEGKSEEEIRAHLPYIELRMFFSYDSTQNDLGPVGELVVDLDMNCTEALLVLRYELKGGAIEQLLGELNVDNLEGNNRLQFFEDIQSRIPTSYHISMWAEDPNDTLNRKPVTQSTVQAIVKTNFINAQRGLDDITTHENDILAGILEELFKVASRDTASDKDKKLAEDLRNAIGNIQEQIDRDFSKRLADLIPTLEIFGYPGQGGPSLTTETTLDVERLLKNHTKVRYEGCDGVSLPESYNGLGMRNLIFILFQILRFYRDFCTTAHPPAMHLIFIEEPEAHLHPQVQEVFIRQIVQLAEKLNKEKASGDMVWPVQFVVSTHSPHIANESSFEAIRYFLPRERNSEKRIWNTAIKDLRKGLSGVSQKSKDFLHQYLTLTRCDLFFADKAILIEGTTERLLLPVMVRKLDETRQLKPQLGSQYISVMEVGGAYAHIFFNLLEFLELQSVVITDLDPLGSDGKKCNVNGAVKISNACIKDWFKEKKSDWASLNLFNRPEKDKIKKGIRIAYQRPEKADGPCGRTFEDAFMLANPAKFSVPGGTVAEVEAYVRGASEGEKKSAFALKYAIQDSKWETPLYIREALEWLADGLPSAAMPATEQEGGEASGERRTGGESADA